ncbi:hypothetical protein F5I97DRAFT_1928227 [Phlebopus sp. FC_14]|nr:hypothetical protein F5I97DRAFT_1928227 [Phlebopus sp. FC_14]
MRLRYFLALSLPFIISASIEDQTPFLGSSEMTKESSQESTYTPLTSPQPTLADLLTIEPSASIYYSYARETEISSEFGNVDQQLTLLVPTNKAVMALARKPHQGPVHAESKIEISEQELDEQSRRNVQRWVTAHIILSHISLSDVPVTYDTMLDGKSVTFIPAESSDGRSPDWAQVTLEDGTRIIGRKEGINGVIYLIDGTIDPS